MSFDALRWDSHYRAVQVEIVQFKTSKPKLVAFPAGPTPDRCWFTHLGDLLAMDRVDTYRPDVGTWLFPYYQGKDKGQGVGRIIKDMNFRDAGAKEKFRAVATAAGVDLPVGAAAAGIRQGACTELNILPVHQAIATSGHDMGGICKYYEYVQSTMAQSMIGAQILAGWPAPTHGHATRGPRPASLDALKTNGVCADELDDIIDAVFYLDPTRPHMLLKRVPAGELGAGMPGALRPAVQAAFASIVMHYQGRRRDSLMPQVQTRLEEAVSAACTASNPRATLEQWGDWIRAQFNLDNLHLTAMQEVVGMKGLADVVARLGSNLGDVSGTLRTIVTAQNELAAAVSQLMSAAGSKRAPEEVPASPTPRRVKARGAEDAADDTAFESSPFQSSIAVQQASMGTPVGSIPLSPAVPATVNDALLTTAVHQANEVSAPTTMDVIYRVYMERGASPVAGYTYHPGIDSRKATPSRYALGCFIAMSTDAEKIRLKDMALSEGERAKLCEEVSDLVIMWWRQLHKTAGVKVPPTLQEPKAGRRPDKMSVDFLENRVRAFRLALADPAKRQAALELLPKSAFPETWEMAQWRAAWENVKTEEPLASRWKAQTPRTWLPWPVEPPATPEDPLPDDAALDDSSRGMAMAPQTQSQQMAPPGRSGGGGGMLKFLVPRREGEVGTRSFG